MRVVTEQITPARAMELLERNEGNRRVRKTLVSDLRGAMDRGEWRVTHQPIAIDADGNLLDGQHRLTAVARHGRPVVMTVAYGVSRDTFGVIDIGAKRSVVDHFGEKYYCEPLAFLSRLLFGQTATIVQMRELGSVIDTSLRIFADGANKTIKRALSASPVKAAAVMQIVRGVSPEYVLAVYDMVIGQQTDNPKMPPIGHAFIRQANAKYGKDQQRAVFVKALKLFDPAQAEQTRPSVKNPDYEINFVREELRERLDRLVQFKAA